MSFSSFILQTMQYVLCTSVEKSPQTNPIIGRIECKAGHGAGRPTQKMVFDHLHCLYFLTDPDNCDVLMRIFLELLHCRLMKLQIGTASWLRCQGRLGLNEYICISLRTSLRVCRLYMDFEPVAKSLCQMITFEPFLKLLSSNCI